jgi:DNA replication protein DnaC
MSITIKKNSKPRLPLCVMSCDKPLHEKLNKYEMTKTCINKHHTTAIIGKPGQGKSSLMYSFMKSKNLLKKCFNTLFYIAPANSMNSMDDNIFSKLPEDQIFTELNGEILDEIIERAKNREDGDKICLIIIDDMASQLKNGDVQKALKQIAMNKRHLGIYSTFIMSNLEISTIRGKTISIDNIILFKVSPDEMESIFTETLPQYKSISQDIQKIVYDKPHEYLVINTETGRLFKKFDELIINEE